MALKTLFGQRVWTSSYLKLYFPFIITGTTAFFLFGSAHTALSNAPDDKWNRIVQNGEEASKRQALKSAALAWSEKH